MIPRQSRDISSSELRNKLRSLRERRGLSARALDEKAGFSQAKISKIENGQRLAKPEDVRRRSSPEQLQRRVASVVTAEDRRQGGAVNENHVFAIRSVFADS
jgi:transcriptional regulator with XRE-family HTH domain